MENFYVTIENEEDKELIVLSKSSADPKILERIEKHRDNFNFVNAPFRSGFLICD
jgi:magnesium transporter